jgi:putative nucleotidyltransferase with HDIG domain
MTRFLRLRRVKWKIMLPFVLLTGLFAMFATRNITQLVSASLEERVDSQLVAAAQQAADAVAKRERDQLEVVRTVANTQGVAEAVASRDAAGAEALILPAAANSRAEHVGVFDRSGRSVFGVEHADDPQRRAAWGVDRVPEEWVAAWAVLGGEIDARGDKWAQVAQGRDGPVLLSAGPIKDEAGKVVGVAVVASSLDALLRTIKRDTFAETTFFGPDGGLLVSSFDPDDASDENAYFRGPADGTGAGSGGNGVVLGRPYRFLNSELRVRGEVAGAMSVALSLDAVASTGSATRLRMALIFGAITLGVMIIGWMIAGHLTSPLGRLVIAAELVSQGDLSARSNVRTGDEIGLLGARFDAMAERLELQHVATIGALASAIDARDPYTAGHSIRVGDLSAELGAAIGLPKAALHHLRIGGLLHDIGKIGVPDKVLLKKGRLTAGERRLIELHPTIGLRILESAQLPTEVLQIVGGHHERLNGAGYPLGLSAEELSIFPRVAGVADVYDALTTDRPYRAGLSPQEAIRTLWRESEGGLLDPEIVAAMRRIMATWEERRATSTVLTKAWIESLHVVRRGAADAA